MCWQAGQFILQVSSGKAITVEDRELVHRRFPVVCGATPVCGDIVQCQPEQLGRGIVARKVASRLHDLAQLGVHTFDGIRNRHDMAGAPRSRAAQFRRMV